MLHYREKLLNETQLKKLENHKYSCENSSLVDPYLQPFWNWLIKQVPIWVAPNLITILGLFVNILTTLILVVFSPDMKETAPKWATYLCAFGLFVYQSLDAIDGKQARRTNTSSPLGELFDHGCDSISTVFVAISTCVSVQMGNCPKLMFFEVFVAFALFYCAHWQTFVSGTLHFGQIDVTEAQCAIIVSHIVTAAFGPQIWSFKIAFNFEPRFVIVIMTLIIGFLVLYDFVTTIRKGGCGKNGSTVAGTSIVSPIVPFLLILVPALTIAHKSKSGIYENHPALFILMFGIIVAKVTNRLVVAHMTKSEMHYVDWGLLGPLLLFLNQYFNEFIPEYYVLWLALVWVTYDLCVYCSLVCLEICDHLKIDLFTIPIKTNSHKRSDDLNQRKKFH